MFGLFERKSAVEARVLDALDNGFSGTSLPKQIPMKQALSVIAVFAACRVISEDVAKLPAKLKQIQGDATVVAANEPEHVILSRIGKAPNDVDDGYTAMEWIEQVVYDAAFRGHGVAHLNRVVGRVKEATPVPFDAWRNDVNGWELYQQGQGWVRVDRRDLMVLRGPQLGTNVTQSARRAIELARQIDAMQSSLAKKSGRANGIISSEKLNSKEKAAAFIKRIKDYFGPQGEGGLMPLDLGQLHHIRLSMSPEELQADTTYARAINEIAAAWRVQPSRIMHQITDFNNAGLFAANATHVQDCVQPWAKRFRQTFDKDVLGADLIKKGFYCDIALQGLLQGAPDERGKLYMALRTVGAMSPKTVAQFEDLPTEHVSEDPAFPLLTNPNPKGNADAPEA